MKLGSDILACLLFVPTSFTLAFLLSALSSIHSLGKSKTKRKKELHQVPVWRKVLLLGYVESCKCHVRNAKRLCILYRFYLTVLFLCLGIWGLKNTSTTLYYVSQCCILVKVIILDVPINAFSCIMTEHGKNGGVTWKWEKNC